MCTIAQLAFLYRNKGHNSYTFQKRVKPSSSSMQMGVLFIISPHVVLVWH